MFQPVLIVPLRIVLPRVGTAALLASQGALGGDFRQIQQIPQLDGFQQLGIEFFAPVLKAHLPVALLQFVDFVDSSAHLVLDAEHADVVHHHLLELGADVGRRLTARAA